MHKQKHLSKLIPLFIFALVCIAILQPQTVHADGLSGSGTIQDPYQITDCDDLESMNNNLSAVYTLTGDIDCSATSGWNNDSGFVPIGNSGQIFTGELDGQGYTISNLYINETTGFGLSNNVGLFGNLQGAVYDLNITSATVIGSGGAGNIGGLAGVSNSPALISGVVFTGTVSDSGNCNSDIGGLLGTANQTDLSDSSSEGSVQSCSVDSGSVVGGLIGLSIDNQITNVLSQSNVSSNNAYGSAIGGLLGDSQNDTISNSYSSGSLTGAANLVGGLIGASNAYGTVTNSFTVSPINSSTCSSATGCGAMTSFNNYGLDFSTDYYDQTAVGVDQCFNNSSSPCIAIDTSGSPDPTYFDLSSSTPPLPPPFTNWDFTSTWQTSNSLPLIFGFIPANPSTPLDVSAQAAPGSSNIYFTWQDPTSNGGPPISRYVLNYEVTGSNQWISISASYNATSTTLNLSSSTSYTIDMVTVNQNQYESLASPEIQVTTYSTVNYPAYSYIGLQSVSCLTSTDCVAVGITNSDQGPLIETYNNAEWSIAATTDPPNYDNRNNGMELIGVSCTSSDFCVAVGYYYDNNDQQHALVETYNGTSWTPTTGIDPSDYNSGVIELTSVSCTSSDFCVAVGYYYDNNDQQHALVETYNGTSWTPTTGIDPSDANGQTYLEGVSCVNSTDCVAVGYYKSNIDYDWHALVETYNGTSWTPTTGIDPSDYYTAGYLELRGVSCVSATDCVAAGYYQSNVDYKLDAFIETYNGTNWTVTTGMDPSDYSNDYLYGISCTSSTSCVAVGEYLGTDNEQYAIVETYNGTSWTPTTGIGPDDDQGQTYLNGVSCTSSTSCVAVGEYLGTDGYQHALSEILSEDSWESIGGYNTDTPTDFSDSSISDTGAQLSWQEPADSDGYPALIYLISYEVSGSSVWSSYYTDNNLTTVLFTGLLPNTSYTFTISSMNDNVHTSAPSASITFMTTAAKSYVINTCQELEDIANDLDGNYVLGQNIDCSATINWNDGAGFIPIGSVNALTGQGTYFEGTLNGDGYTISNLYENQVDQSNLAYGLFAVVQNATISNLTLSNITVNAYCVAGFGTLAGGIFSSSIANVQVVDGTVSGTMTFQETYVGGLVGEDVGSSIIQSSFSGNIDTNDATLVSGLVAYLQDSSTLATIANSYSQVNITGIAGLVSGLVGAIDGVVSNSYSAGTISTSDSQAFGGLVGININQDGQANIANSFSDISISTENSPGVIVGGLVGITDGDNTQSIIDTSDYFDANLAGTNSCTGDRLDSCTPINTLGDWTTPSGIGSGNGINQPSLDGSACTGASNCIAVGYYIDNDGYPHALIETYNGSGWMAITGLDPSDYNEGEYGIDLTGISCTSSTDCVASGYYLGNDGNTHALIETYNGSGWTAITGLDPAGAAYTGLSSISCTSPTSCVAVGQYYDTNHDVHALAETLSGDPTDPSDWAIDSNIDPSDLGLGNQINLSSVSCTSSTSCVAGGYYSDINSTSHALIEVYDGSGWTATSGIDPGDADGEYTAINALSCSNATSCVAVGQYIANNDSEYALIETLDGNPTNPSDWTSDNDLEPSGGGDFVRLNGVSCITSTSCEAVGYYHDAEYEGHVVVYDYDGSGWTATTGLDPSDSDETTNAPYAISCISAGGCIAVGWYQANDNTSHALIEDLVAGTEDTNPQPTYFDDNTANAPLNNWDFNSIWETTSGLPIFIPNQYVLPPAPQANPNPVTPPSNLLNSLGPKTPSLPPYIPAAAVSTPTITAKPKTTTLVFGSSDSGGSGGNVAFVQAVSNVIRHFVSILPKGVVTSFPYALFICLLIGGIVAIIEIIRQARLLKTTQLLIAKQTAIAEERDTFWHLAANYLRAPVTLMVGGAEILSLEKGHNTVSADIAKLTNSLQSKVAGIMKQIEDSHSLQDIKWPELDKTKRVIFQSRFWVPVLVVAALAGIGDFMAKDYRHLHTSTLTYVTQGLIFVIVVFLLYWALGALGIVSSKRKQAEQLLKSQAKSLDQARTILITKTTSEIDSDVAGVSKLLLKLNSQNKALPLLNEGAHRLRQIIDNFQLLINVQNNHLDVANQVGVPPKVSDLLTRAMTELKPSIESKNLKLALPKADATALPGNEQAISQVLSSVLANAVEFSPSGSTVTVTEVQDKPGRVTLSIADQGVGITKDQLAHLFQPFARADGLDALQLNHGGLGLNLYLDKLIMDKMGGSIKVKSVSHKGSVFMLSWPIRQRSTHPRQASVTA